MDFQKFCIQSGFSEIPKNPLCIQNFVFTLAQPKKLEKKWIFGQSVLTLAQGQSPAASAWLKPLRLPRARPCTSDVFLLNQVLTCTESATSECSTTSQCLSALLGPAVLAVCCFVLLTRGWGRLETRPPVAMGSSPAAELSTFFILLKSFLSFRIEFLLKTDSG